MNKSITYFLLGGLILLISNNSYAQKELSSLNILLKAGSYSHYYNKANENYNDSNNTLLTVFYEIPIAENMTVSPTIGLPFNFDYVIIGGRVDYYFDGFINNLPEPLDLWGGVDSGFVLGGEGDTFIVNLHGGGEWRFNDTWGGIVEFGAGTSSYGSIGVGIHF
ncbi:MAG: hypothetical protein KAH72_11590 [Flavobacteriaceae bacterium]|nr:hypothetical protein [Flavobacteriaceae bacterium]